MLIRVLSIGLYGRFPVAFAVLVVLVAGAFAFASAENEASVAGSGERGGITLTIGAVRHADGETTGNATFHNRNTNSKLSIDVTSISIDLTNQLATVVGEVTKSTNSYTTGFPVGSLVSFQVEDEGEGSGAIPDGFTMPLRIGGPPSPAPFPRADGGILPESESGNLHVRGTGRDGNS